MMKISRLTASVVALATTIALLSVSALAQGKMNSQASPRKSAEMTLNGKKISVDYGAPSVRGRKIVGGLVPYNEVWRFGANEATHFKTEADLLMGNVTVPKGTYTLWIWPTESGWKLIINKATGVWGTPYKYEGDELARVDMKLEKTSAPVEQMVISLNNAKEGGVLNMKWENTSASVHFTEKK